MSYVEFSLQNDTGINKQVLDETFTLTLGRSVVNQKGFFFLNKNSSGN